jgi:hypothetical protein
MTTSLIKKACRKLEKAFGGPLCLSEVVKSQQNSVEWTMGRLSGTAV